MYCYNKYSVALSSIGLQCVIVVFPDHIHFFFAKIDGCENEDGYFFRG